MHAESLHRFKKSLDNKLKEKFIEGLLNKYPRKFQAENEQSL